MITNSFRVKILMRSWKALMFDERGKLKPEAVRVLADLEGFCKDPALISGGGFPSDDSQALAYARRREPLHRIFGFLKMTEYEVEQLEKETDI